MKVITSAHNDHYKLLKELIRSSRSRREHRASWIEGETLCQAYLENKKGSPPDRPVAVLAQRKIASEPRLRTACREVWQMSDRLFDSVSLLESPTGMGLIIPIAVPARDGLIADRHKAASPDVVILDRVSDPGNAGTLLRSAAAAGITEIWAVEGTVDLWAPKVLRSAMGAHFLLDIYEDLSAEKIRQFSADLCLPLYAASPSPHAESLYAVEGLRSPCGWIFGQEGAGLDETFLKMAKTVTIPQQRAVESLNVSAAAAVCLFEMRRQRLSR